VPALLDSFGLIDRIGRPTHRYGRQLDVLISRADQTAPAIRADPPLLSDHSLIVASISAVSKQHTAAVSIQRRRWESFDFDPFRCELEQSLLVIDQPSHVTDLFRCYHKMLRQLLHKHAPLHQVKVRS
jgi:hypothetical protein